jgi:hypothetical protein
MFLIAVVFIILPTMSLLTELKFLPCRFLQICRAYGASKRQQQALDEIRLGHYPVHI